VTVEYSGRVFVDWLCLDQKLFLLGVSVIHEVSSMGLLGVVLQLFLQSLLVLLSLTDGGRIVVELLKDFLLFLEAIGFAIIQLLTMSWVIHMKLILTLVLDRCRVLRA
jgi:hypothetical protein